MEQPHLPEKTPETIGRLMRESDAALNARQLDTTIALCDEALAIKTIADSEKSHLMQRKAIALSMKGRQEEAHELFGQLLEVEGDNPLRAGDVMRDIAFAYLRGESRTNGDIDQAETFITTAEQRHQNDQNRMAVLLGGRGRVAFARGVTANDAASKNEYYKEAIRYHQEADNAWDAMEQPDKQWRFNNRLPQLTAHAALGDEVQATRILRQMREDSCFTDDHRQKVQDVWRVYFDKPAPLDS